MQKTILYLILTLLFLSVNSNGIGSNAKNKSKAKTIKVAEPNKCLELYDLMQLKGIINYAVFKHAYDGYKKINARKKDILTLIDYSKPSTEERFYVLDMANNKLLYSTYVSHGKRSGEKYATSFSNKPGSHKSSPGFYVTENTYEGKNGYSLIIDGLEKGINDRAKERSIVIHSAAYCDSSFIETEGRLGRSFGCPALPENISTAIIDTIKDGTLLYIYANDKNYLRRSKIL